MARGLNFRFKEVEGLHYLCSENKGADQLCGYFVFAYAKSRFSHDAAHIKSLPEFGHSLLFVEENLTGPYHK